MLAHFIAVTWIVAAVSDRRHAAIALDDAVSMLQFQSTLQVPLRVPAAQASANEAQKSCEMDYSPGIHVIQLPRIGRQFLLAVPHSLVESSSGVPLVVSYHGTGQSPWAHDKHSGMSNLLEHYGWLGILPFGLNWYKTNGLDGVRACCPSDCDEQCCKNGLHTKDASDSACSWRYDSAGAGEDLLFTEAIVDWAAAHTCTDASKVFATGFGGGATLVNKLACEKSHLFQGVAPHAASMATDNPTAAFSDQLKLNRDTCNPTTPISYISGCGTGDELSQCYKFVDLLVEHWSHLNECSGSGSDGAPLVLKMSDTSNCTSWSKCAGGNFVEFCYTAGFDHGLSGRHAPGTDGQHRPASDLDISAYTFQKFSLLVDHKMIFYGHPNKLELALKGASFPPPALSDHPYLRMKKTPRMSLMQGAVDRPIPDRLIFNYKSNLMQNISEESFVIRTTDAVLDTLRRHRRKEIRLLSQNGLAQNLKRTLAMLPDVHDVDFRDDAGCSAAIEAAHSKELATYFDNEPHGPYKSDMCRLAQLAVHGGYYFDTDMVILEDIRKILPPQTSFASIIALPYGRENPRPLMFQSFIAAAPGHPVILSSLDKFLELYQGRNETLTLRSQGQLVGPFLMRVAYEEWSNHRMEAGLREEPGQDKFKYTFLLEELGLGGKGLGRIDSCPNIKSQDGVGSQCDIVAIDRQSCKALAYSHAVGHNADCQAKITPEEMDPRELLERKTIIERAMQSIDEQDAMLQSSALDEVDKRALHEVNKLIVLSDVSDVSEP